MRFGNSRNQFIWGGFEHAGDEGEEYEKTRYLYANESWTDGWSRRMELSSVLVTASVPIAPAHQAAQRPIGKLQSMYTPPLMPSDPTPTNTVD
jgi:hypothetical protein